MVSLTILSPLAFLAAVCLRLLKATSSRVAKHKALHDIHGPPSTSFLTGKSVLARHLDNSLMFDASFAGNLTQIISHAGLGFFNELLARYGSVAKIHGLCGVGLLVF